LPVRCRTCIGTRYKGNITIRSDTTNCFQCIFVLVWWLSSWLCINVWWLLNWLLSSI
jgi:hypothetical protein